MDKVYIVTTGSYSDYHIEAVFSKKELADEYCKRAGSSYDIEEWQLDEPIPDVCFLVEMSKSGEVFSVEKTIDDTPGIICFFPPGLGQTWDDHILWVVKTDDVARAIKVVNEKRFQILALDIWGDTDKVIEIIK